ncbi:hypothetical protein Lalb_Chr20g0111051 [Lupinus albus]|uniref:Uncharacterized protein n=1 Tax=Lupinus albus TaxID=3870 RepID=A0A6A4NNE9_LUPAL|nr:hypothetical protein Lalb_Chr20g0111051 [Lupinus albus]
MNHLRNNKYPFLHFHNLYQQQCRTIVKVRLKWVKNRSLDHIIDKETDLKAASLLKDAIKRSSTGFLTEKNRRRLAKASWPHRPCSPISTPLPNTLS